MSAAIHFEAESHTYRVAGRELPSVTTVLKSAGLIDLTWYTEDARVVGQHAHLACRFDDENDLDESNLPPVVAGRVAAWRAFKRDTGAEVLAIEQPVANESHGYAGTLDRRIRWHGALWVIELKPATPERWHALQLAAYAACVTQRHRRAVVHLHEDGKYRVREYDDPRDLAVFHAALTLHNWRKAA